MATSREFFFLLMSRQSADGSWTRETVYCIYWTAE